MRRMALHRHRSPGGVRPSACEEDRAEVEALYQDLLINVTSFFRDPETFEALKAARLPRARRRASRRRAPIRIWVPGCSTGQEAYSLAIALLEFLDDAAGRARRSRSSPPTSATPPRSSKARAGVYPDSIEADVSPERLRRFFTKEDHGYRINKSIRDMCVFARQNVTADPPFSHLDLISCRNVLIYLATPLQKRVLPTFHYALERPGFLVLGSSETVGEHTDLFELVDRDAQDLRQEGRPPSATPLHFAADGPPSTPAAVRAGTGRRAPTPVDFQKEADRILLGPLRPARRPGQREPRRPAVPRAHRAPTSSRRRASRASNLLKMAREGLLPRAAQRAARGQEDRQARAPRGRPRRRGRAGAARSTLEVMPGPGRRAPAQRCFLVLFDERRRRPRPATPAPRRRRTEARAALPTAATSASSTQLRAGARRARKEYLQSLIEEQDAANEELRSANEEILSSNEELQSTNEELETAKEELQSANEELTTVNEELQHRNLELTPGQQRPDQPARRASNIPIVMVGSDLRIRRFTRRRAGS